MSLNWGAGSYHAAAYQYASTYFHMADPQTQA